MDNIAHIELGAEKRKYSKKNVSVLNGAIEEYWNFVKYSINDVLLQYGIDAKTNDLDTLFDQAIYGGTRFTKTLKQSVYLKNFWAIEYFKRNIVPGNNLNVNYAENKNEELATDIDLYRSMRPDDSDEDIDYDNLQLPGALVGEPTLNSNEGVDLYGFKSSHLFKLVIDMDYTAEYPNAKRTANISPCTQWGRIIITNKILPNENPDNNPKFLRGGKFIEDIETGDAAKIGLWLELPKSYDLIKKFDKLRSKNKSEDSKYYRIKSRKLNPMEE